MPRVPIHSVGSLGIVRDIEDYELPPEAWSSGNNMRMRDGRAERLVGRTEVFGTPAASIGPEFAISVPDAAAQTFWVYPSLTKINVYQGGTHSDITRTTGGDYSATNGYDWNGTVFQGVPIVNNGTDIPQSWTSISVATPMSNLANWISTMRVAVLRSFKSFLVGLNVTDTADSPAAHPHRIIWSDVADPGSVPGSWDVGDATTLSGERDLSDVDAGSIRDGLVLGGNFYIYKDGSTWRMTFIGGNSVFRTEEVLQTSGILSARNVSLVKKGLLHFLHNGDDLITFDGREARSVLDKRQRKALNSALDSSNFRNSFTFDDPGANTAWFVYPTNGQTRPNAAVLWNYEENTITEASFTGNYAASGVIEELSTETWDSDSGAWDLDSSPWSEALRRQVLIADATNLKFYQTEVGTTFAGTAYTAFLERTGLAVAGRDRAGNPKVDIASRKLFSRVWPKVTGGPISVRIGGQERVGSSVTYQTAKQFDPSSQEFLDADPPINARAIAVRFEDQAGSSVNWGLDSYDVDVEVVSEH